MACNWIAEDYFAQLMCPDRRSHNALEMLVDDLHAEKERTITTFLCHSGSEDFLWGLVRLLGNDTPRVAGNAAYIIGTLAESELGCYRILSLAKGRSSESRKILSDLTRMLTFDDPESVMNAAGTMGTLAESPEGREWMLSEPSIEGMVDHVTLLLNTENLWTASNAALVLARLCISEEGCNSILKHSHSHSILTRLILALGVDEAGRGMNAAFAIGRLCDMDSGRHRLLGLPDSEKMITSLVKMLSCEDTGASKNACFALSCLATNLEGHGRLLNNSHSDDVLKTLSSLLMAEDCETGWFAAMTLRTLASQPKGCLRLREFPQVSSALKKVGQMSEVNPDLKEEVVITLEILKRLEPPENLVITVLGPNLCHASWNQVTTKSGLDVKYHLYEGHKCLYNGPNCQMEIPHLSPYTAYHFKIRAVTEGDESPFSDVISVTTEEDLPEAPTNVRILGSTITQLKVGWDPPENPNGVLKGYYVYQGKTMVEHTQELSAIISGLSANTSYEIQVCCATWKGKGSRAATTGTTAELGAHAPSKPHVQVLGRNEVHVAWEPPEVPLGRITRYDVSMNGKIIYSGTDLSCGMRRLTPDTEYSFVVTALTNEGKFESKVTKKRTSKDEFDPDRPPLYQPPKKEEDPQKSASQKKRKSVGDLKSPGSHSAKGSLLSSTPERPASATSINSGRPTMVGESPRPEKVKDEDTPTPQPSSSPKARTLNKAFDTRKENVRPRTHKDPSTSSTNNHLSAHSSHRNTPSASSGSRGDSNHASSHHPHPHHSSNTKSSSLSKPSFPVTVSYVSIQGGDDQNLELDAIGPEFVNKKTFVRSPTFYENSHHSSNRTDNNNFSTLRVERSRTSLFTGKSSSNSPHHSNNKHRLGRLDNNHHHHHHNGGNHHHHHLHPHQNSHSNNNGDFSRHVSAGNHSRSSSDNRIIGNGGGGGIHGKSPWLPKPSVPSPEYLEGNRVLSGASGNFSSMPPNSPRVSFDTHLGEAELEAVENALQRGKGKEEGGGGGGRSTPLFHTRSKTPVDAYFIEQQQAFIQRANTFVSSHRPGLKKAMHMSMAAPVQLMGSASLQLPDHKQNQQRSHNKFIPMQLRTQPTNLTANQLHRMNTTLVEPNRGLPGRRLEALTRSQTTLSMKSNVSNASHRSAPPQAGNGAGGIDMELLGVTTQNILNGTTNHERVQPNV